jgi:Zn-dependent protease
MLKFRLGAVPVSVHLSFLILALFGWMRFGTAVYTAAWTVGVFFAILAHEAGHAFTARGFGVRGVRIMLFAFGGATTYPLTNRITPGKRFLISAAGSAVGIATGAALMLVGSNQGWFDLDFGGWPPYERINPDFLSVMVVGYVEAALFWGILNWLPMRPLDGGQMVQSFLEMVAPSIAEPATKAVSLAVGVPVIVLAVANQQIFAAMIVGFLLMSGLRNAPAAPPGPAPPQSGPVESGRRPPLASDPAASAERNDEPPDTRRDGSPPPPSDFPI